MQLVIFEDDQFEHFLPLAWTRAVFELKTGATTLLEKLSRRAGTKPAAVLTRPYLAAVVADRWADGRPNDLSGLKADETLFLNARLGAEAADLPRAPGAGWRGDTLAWFRTTGDVTAIASYEDLVATARDAPAQPHDRPWYEYIWDLMLANPEALAADFQVAGQRGVEGSLHASAVVLGSHDDLYIAPGAEVQPFVCIDNRGGPVTIAADAEVQPFTRIEGPAYVGPGAILLGAKVREGCSIGPLCRVGGEVEESIIHGYSNKYHDGFLGHAYVGEWVNLGALTTNSDLKNDYSSVSVVMNGRSTDTGSNKVGAFIGDHVKTSIGTLLNTGSHVGPLAVLVGQGGPLPKFIPAFAWYLNGKIGKGFGLGPLLDTARVAMGRRKRDFTAADDTLLRHIYDLTAEERNVHVRRARRALAVPSA